MRNPLLNYSIICKTCSEQVKADIDFYSKRRFLNEPKKAYIELTCSKCGAKDQYHVNRIYARSKVIWVILVWVFSIGSAIWLGDYMFDTYWRDDVRVQNDSIAVIFAGTLLPLALGGMITYRIAQAGNRFNNRILE